MLRIVPFLLAWIGEQYEFRMPIATKIAGTATPLPVAIGKYFDVCLYLLAFTGFATLASTGGLDLPTTLLVSAAFLFRGYLLAEQRKLIIPERWTTFLTVLYVGFYLADYFLLSGSFLTSTVHLVLFVLIVRLFSAQRDRDQYFIAIISFLMVMAAAVLTVDSTFFFAFAAFMLIAVITVILMEMKHAANHASIRPKETADVTAHRHMAFSLAGITPALVVLILSGAGAIFFLLPRFSAGYLSTYAASSELSTGFSDQVHLGTIGRIQQSSAVVMHIKIDGDQAGAYDLKWRGVSLSDFDGNTWSNPHKRHIASRMVNGAFDISNQANSSLPRQRIIHYEVLMEPMGNNVFFLASTAQQLAGDYRIVAVDDAGAVFDLDIQHPIGRYQGTSVIPQAGETQSVHPATYRRDQLKEYLNVPATLDPRIPALAQTITTSLGDNYEKAVAIEGYLRSKFGYTLQLPRTAPRDPLANFLFERRQGHCEYFASAMAVLLRTQNIPSRVVNGFRTGEFNDISSQYVVRASNAHSWVEAYFPERGWVSFDPTPAGIGELHTGWGRLLLYFDAAASFWREWIVSYDVGHQRMLGTEVRQNTRQMLGDLRRWARLKYAKIMKTVRQTSKQLAHQPVGWTLAGVLSVILLLLVSNAQRILHGLRSWQLARQPDKHPSAAAGVWYERMLRVAARKGWKKKPAQTPTEFAKSIENDRLRDSVALFTRHYQKARFGDSTEDASELPELYEEIASIGQK